MSETPRTDAADGEWSEDCRMVPSNFARQLERELAEAKNAGNQMLENYTKTVEQLNTLREGVEKLAEEYTRLADTSDDEDFITEKRALARELRALLK